MKQLTKKKFNKKWPRDEWLQKTKKKAKKHFDKFVLVGIGNLKKWINVKYYGYKD